MLKHAAVLMAVLVVGCDTPDGVISQAETSASKTPSFPAVGSAPASPPMPPVPAPIVGCWADVTPAATETISINANGTCSDGVVAQKTIDGAPFTQTIEIACTWTAQDATTLAFSYQTNSPICTYSIADDTLTLFCPYMLVPQSYRRVACL